MDKPKATSPNLQSRMGTVEARMDTVETRLSSHEQRIGVLEQGDAAMLLKLSENDSRWQKVEEKLQVVDSIRDIQVTLSTVGKLFGAAAKAIRWGVTITALVCGIYIAIHTGDLSSLSTLIGQLIGMP